MFFSQRKRAGFSPTPSTIRLTAIFTFPLSSAAAISRSQFQPPAKAPPSPNAFAAKSKSRSIEFAGRHVHLPEHLPEDDKAGHSFDSAPTTNSPLAIQEQP